MYYFSSELIPLQKSTSDWIYGSKAFMVHIHPKPQIKLTHISLVSHHLLAHSQKALATPTSIGFGLSLKISQE